MVENTNAVFFDGQSSVPQKTSLFFDKEKAVLLFENSQKNTICWNLKDITFDKKADVLSLYSKNNPFQNLNIKDQELIKNITTFQKKNIKKSGYQLLLDLGIKIHFLLSLLILGIIILSYIYLIPYLAEKTVVLIPDTYDNKLGTLFIEQNLFFDSIDTNKTKILNEFAKELKLNNTKKLNFLIINSNEVNAFALPNGTIVVYTGILNSMKNYDELVGLIGHEVAHVNNRHSIKTLCRNLSGYLFISTILGDVNGVMATIGDNVNTLQSLSFSREFERQADLDGFKILTFNKINPKGMSNLFYRLKKEEFVTIPEFISSHPMTNNRIQYINKLIKTNSFEFKEHPKLRTLFKQLKK